MELIHPINVASGALQAIPPVQVIPPIQVIPPVRVPSGPFERDETNVPLTHGVDQSDTEDIYRLSPHVTTGFADTFMESKDIMGFSFMERANGGIYNYAHFGCYATLNLFLAPFIAFWFGLLFAVMHFALVWFVQPIMKLYYICLRATNMMYEPTLRLFCDPFHRSVALVLSGIKGQFKINSSDVKPSQV